jgi:hypothetical protein
MDQQSTGTHNDHSPEPPKIRLFRYAIVDGVRTLRDSQISAIFEMAKKK